MMFFNISRIVMLQIDFALNIFSDQSYIIMLSFSNNIDTESYQAPIKLQTNLINVSLRLH